ncbi:MAG: hypothetical protein ACOZE5_00030 [Verrucomicrobiota bacterium]
MRTAIEQLFALQKLLLPANPSAPPPRAEIAALRKLVPPPILGHFDRMVSQGRHGVALVRHGVCGECHIRVPVGTLVSLIKPRDAYLCEVCGCYLMLPLDELPTTAKAVKNRPAVRRVRPKAAVPAATTVVS